MYIYMYIHIIVGIFYLSISFFLFLQLFNDIMKIPKNGEIKNECRKQKKRNN